MPTSYSGSPILVSFHFSTPHLSIRRCFLPLPQSHQKPSPAGTSLSQPPCGLVLGSGASLPQVPSPHPAGAWRPPPPWPSGHRTHWPCSSGGPEAPTATSWPWHMGGPRLEPSPAGATCPCSGHCGTPNPVTPFFTALSKLCILVFTPHLPQPPPTTAASTAASGPVTLSDLQQVPHKDSEDAQCQLESLSLFKTQPEIPGPPFPRSLCLSPGSMCGPVVSSLPSLARVLDPQRAAVRHGQVLLISVAHRAHTTEILSSAGGARGCLEEGRRASLCGQFKGHPSFISLSVVILHIP